MKKGLIEELKQPPTSPKDCIFARTTLTVSADLNTRITPWPSPAAPQTVHSAAVSRACGSFAAVGHHQVVPGVTAGQLFFPSVPDTEQGEASSVLYATCPCGVISRLPGSRPRWGGGVTRHSLLDPSQLTLQDIGEPRLDAVRPLPANHPDSLLLARVKARARWWRPRDEFCGSGPRSS